MPDPTERPTGVLALLADPVPMQPLLKQLQSLGMQVDIAPSLADARALFFGAGGHDCLVVAPDVRPALATQVLHSLRGVDPQLATATFGPALETSSLPARSARLAGFHPSSRAGTGALLRFLQVTKRR